MQSNRFPKPSYPFNTYDDVLDMAPPTIVYDVKKSSSTNWIKTYKRIKDLKIQYDVELDEEHDDYMLYYYIFPLTNTFTSTSKGVILI
ncbi:hypothetical protein G6F42_027114 [Rhizopus arrhizus]|nr:hypothetical protein G6F42_027114 [Rhizopus arrhizus]